jgi:hypothetical protein
MEYSLSHRPKKWGWRKVLGPQLPYGLKRDVETRLKCGIIWFYFLKWLEKVLCEILVADAP